MDARPPIPRRVALACLGQVLLTVSDLFSVTLFAFGLLGMMTSPSSPDDEAGLVFIGWYGVVGTVGVALGTAALAGFWRGATWARSVAIAHAIVVVLTCCPFAWAIAVWAVLTAIHEEVAAWPERANQANADLADVFR